MFAVMVPAARLAVFADYAVADVGEVWDSRSGHDYAVLNFAGCSHEDVVFNACGGTNSRSGPTLLSLPMYAGPSM